MRGKLEKQTEKGKVDSVRLLFTNVRGKGKAKRKGLHKTHNEMRCRRKKRNAYKKIQKPNQKGSSCGDINDGPKNEGKRGKHQGVWL